MKLDFFQIYLMVINIISFVLFSIDFLIYRSGKNGISVDDRIFDFLTVFGGALGTCLAFLVWDRKMNKQNITWRVFAISMLIIQIAVYVAFYGSKRIEMIEWISQFYSEHKLLVIYLMVINIITFIVFGLDKYKAVNGLWRIREIVLLGLSLIGGTIGGIFGMWLFHHKIRSPQFALGMPIMVVAQCCVLFYYLI